MSTASKPTDSGPSSAETILILAQRDADREAIRQVLTRAGFQVELCENVGDLCSGIRRGALAAVLAEEALSAEALGQVTTTLEEQPSWSEIPLLVLLASGRGTWDPWEVVRGLRGSAHVTLLERPLSVVAFVSAVEVAGISRRRQYGMRDELAARKAAEEDLRASRERLALAQDAGGVGIFDWSPGSGMIVAAGPVAEILGVSAGPHSLKYEDWLGIVHPEDVDRLDASVRAFLASSEEEALWEYRVVAPSGEARWIQARARAFRNSSGLPERVVGTNVDITSRRQNEEALLRFNEALEREVRERTARLAESEARYRGLVENTLDIPFSISASGHIRYVGPQVERYGFDASALMGTRFIQVVYGPDRHRVAQSFRRMLLAGEASPVDFRILASDGSRHWMEERGLLVKHSGGEITGLTGVLRDITLRKKFEARQARQEVQLRQLAVRLANARDEEQRRIGEGLHDDVAQLLTACSVKLALASGTVGSSRLGELHQEIDELLREATEKVRSLSFELHSATLRRLGLREAAEELCASMSARFGIRFRVEGDDPSPHLDEGRASVLFKCAKELLFNVAKHAGVDEARVRFSEEDGTLELAVEDRGVGFNVETWKESGMGEGLGLLGIRERVAALGGALSVESEPQVRTRVALRIPIRSSGEPLADVHHPTPTPPEPPSRRPTRGKGEPAP